MKKTSAFTMMLLFSSSLLFALRGEVVYVEGTVDLKTASGAMDWADIGMPVETGDSIITGYDGYAELEMEDGSTIKVNEDSIFKLDEIQREDRKPQNNFQLVLGSASYKFTRAMKEEEPRISTPSTVCGLRGTDFTVLSGIDGTSLYVVEEGSVAVSSQGKEVQLQAEEGVKVIAGQEPGEVFQVLRGKVDYSEFKAESEAAFYEDPAGSLYPLIEQLISYAEQADEYVNLLGAQEDLVSELRKEFNTLEGDTKKIFYREVLSPEEINIMALKQNTRYYAVSAKSMRRFVVGTMYVQMKTKYIMDKENPVYLDFLNVYHQFLDEYESRIVPYLVERDIR